MHTTHAKSSAYISVLIIGVILLTIISLGVWTHTFAVTILVTNKKCDPIHLPSPRVPLPGILVPRDPISADEQGIVKIPPLTLQIDAMHPDVMVVRLFDVPIPITIPDDVIASFDGVRLVKTEMTLRLGEKPVHTLFISCHEK